MPPGIVPESEAQAHNRHDPWRTGTATSRRGCGMVSPMAKTPGSLRALIAAAGCAVALTACSHAMPDSAGSPRGAVDSDDPWITRGSISGGPIVGTPPGPYSPR